VKEAKHYTEVIDVSTFRPVANPYFCEALPSGKEYEHVWNQEACACFFQFKLGLRARCTWSHPIQNPFHEVGNYYDLCITEQEYYDIFDHPWGADCIPGTIDDPGYIAPDNHDDVDPYHIDSEEEDDDVVNEDAYDTVEEEVDDEIEEEVDDEIEEEADDEVEHVEPPIVHPVHPDPSIPTELYANLHPIFDHTYSSEQCTET
jgi:hypothetical protein